MLYNQLIKAIIAEIRERTQLNLGTGAITMLQEYVEAYEEQNVDVETENIITEEENTFHQNIVLFLNDITKSYQRYSLTQLRIQQNLGIVGTAYAILGKCFHNGWFGVGKDLKVALECFIRSAACRNPMGTFELARCYELGNGTRRDLEHSCILYRASYKLGYIRGLHKYALMLIRGNAFVERNVLDGFHILRQAATAKNRVYILPFYHLGMLYRSSICDILNDRRYAFEIFKIGASKGCKFCQFKIGEEYEHGEIVSKDLEKAFSWYKLSAENNLSNAQFKVAEMLYGIKMDKHADINKITRKDKLADVPVAFFNRDKYNKLHGLTELEVAALKQRQLISFEKFYGTNFARLQEGYRMAFIAAKNGNKEAMLLVAEALEKGFGVEKSLLESLWWYKISESFGCDNVREKIYLLELKLEKTK